MTTYFCFAARSGELSYRLDNGSIQIRTRDHAQTRELARLLAGKPVTLDHGLHVGRVVRTWHIEPRADGLSFVRAEIDLGRVGRAAIRDGYAECSVKYGTHLDSAGSQEIVLVEHLALVRRGRCGPECRVLDYQAPKSLRCDAAPRIDEAELKRERRKRYEQRIRRQPPTRWW
jgi:hypothetical protein